MTLMADLSNLDACKTRSPTGKIVGGENIQGFACGTTLESRVNKVQVGCARVPALVQVPYGDFCPTRGWSAVTKSLKPPLAGCYTLHSR